MENMIVCPECKRKFYVVWVTDVFGPPEYCPMCGVEIDYLKCMEEEENDM